MKESSLVVVASASTSSVSACSSLFTLGGDPMCASRLVIPFACCTKSKGLRKPRSVPSICMLFQSGGAVEHVAEEPNGAAEDESSEATNLSNGCRQRHLCRQLHVAPEFVAAARAAAALRPACCLGHEPTAREVAVTTQGQVQTFCVRPCGAAAAFGGGGVSLGPKPPSALSSGQRYTVVVVSGCSVGDEAPETSIKLEPTQLLTTRLLTSLLADAAVVSDGTDSDAVVIRVPRDNVCGHHLNCHCKFADDCRFLHGCREMLRPLQDSFTLALNPSLAESAPELFDEPPASLTSLNPSFPLFSVKPHPFASHPVSIIEAPSPITILSESGPPAPVEESTCSRMVCDAHEPSSSGGASHSVSWDTVGGRSGGAIVGSGWSTSVSVCPSAACLFRARTPHEDRRASGAREPHPSHWVTPSTTAAFGPPAARAARTSQDIVVSSPAVLSASLPPTPVLLHHRDPLDSLLSRRRNTAPVLVQIDRRDTSRGSCAEELSSSSTSIATPPPPLLASSAVHATASWSHFPHKVPFKRYYGTTTVDPHHHIPSPASQEMQQ